MRLKWLPAALRNLDSEASHIAADEPAAARLVVKRVLLITRYIGPYRVRGDTVEILRVFHTLRQPPRQGQCAGGAAVQCAPHAHLGHLLGRRMFCATRSASYTRQLSPTATLVRYPDRNPQQPAKEDLNHERHC